MVRAEIIEEGDAVEITAKFKNGGELTNPEHTKVFYRGYRQDGANIEVVEGITPENSLFVNIQMINRLENEASREKEHSIIIRLPLTCDKKGLHDPIRAGIRGNEHQQQTYELDIFPISTQPQLTGAPEPSTKFLMLTVRERDTPVLEQMAISRSCFPPSPNVAAAVRPYSKGSAVVAKEMPMILALM